MTDIEFLLEFGFDPNKDIVRRKAPNYMYQGHKILNWDKYKILWREINVITTLKGLGKVCPKCGIILKQRFSTHLTKEKLTTYDWALLNQPEVKRYCPICGLLRAPIGVYGLQETCGRKKCMDELFHEYRSKAGRLGFESQQKVLGSTLSRTNNRGISIDVIMPDGRILKLRSQYELWTLLKLLIIDNISDCDISNDKYYLNNTESFDGDSAFSDLLINSGSKHINVEIHDALDTKVISRKKFCTELNGDEFRLVSLDEATVFMLDLQNLGYPVKEILSELKKYHRQDLIPKFHINKLSKSMNKELITL